MFFFFVFFFFCFFCKIIVIKFHLFSQENPYIQRNLVSEVKVPLIYTEDNELLKKNIYSLRDQLVSRGVDAIPIDEFTFPEVNSNWIDFGENVAKTHSTFVFIVSPLLYRLCHEGKYGDKNMFASLAERTKGQHIPMVVLRTLDILYFKHVWKPRIFLVELKDDLDTVSQEDFAAGLNLSSDITLSHRFAADLFILHEAQIFNISVKEFQDSIACESREVIRLTRCLNPQRE